MCGKFIVGLVIFGLLRQCVGRPEPKRPEPPSINAADANQDVEQQRLQARHLHGEHLLSEHTKYRWWTTCGSAAYSKKLWRQWFALLRPLREPVAASYSVSFHPRRYTSSGTADRRL